MSLEEKRLRVWDYCSEMKKETCINCALRIDRNVWHNPLFDGKPITCLSITCGDEYDLDLALDLIQNRKLDNYDKVDDPVNHPSHYTRGKIEVADFIADQKLNFDRGNAVKYVCRAGAKDPDKEIQDLKKAVWYIEHEIKQLEEAK